MTLEDMRKLKAEIERARFAGTRSVSSDGTSVEYKSDAEMARAIADLDRRIREAEGRPPVSTVRISYSKGL